MLRILNRQVPEGLKQTSVRTDQVLQVIGRFCFQLSRTRFPRPLLGGASLALLLWGSLHGQTAQDTQPQLGLLPSNLYSVDKLETIDRVSGNVAYNIPLARLPKVGSTDSFQLALVYNSNTLRATYNFYTDQRLGPGQYASKALLTATNGWSYNFSYRLVSENRPQVLDQQTCTLATFRNTRMWLVTPDGGRHQLDLYGYSDANGDGFFEIDPIRGVQYSCSGSGSNVISGPLTYYTNDGTYIKVVVTNAGVNPLVWNAYLPDGTVISYSDHNEPNPTYPYISETMADRNGNQTVVTVTAFGNTTISNAAGAIQINSGDNGQLSYTSTITATGFNNAPLTWLINWNTIAFSGGTGQYLCTQLGDSCDASQQTRVVSSIQLPSPTGVPLSFSFDYSDAHYLGWGNLRSITYPSGLKMSYSYKLDGSSTGMQSPFFLSNPVVQKQEDYTEIADGSAIPHSDIWTFSYYAANKPCNSMTRPTGGVDTVCFRSLQPTSEVLTGSVYKTISPVGESQEKLFIFNRPFGDDTQAPNPFIAAEVHTLPDSSGNPSTSAYTTHAVDANGNQIQTVFYDWISNSAVTHDQLGQITNTPSGTVFRTISDRYQSPTPASQSAAFADLSNGYWNPSSPNLRNLVTRSSTSGTGPGSVTDSVYDSNGNVLQTLRWDSTKNATASDPLASANSVVESRTYEPMRGNLTSITNPRGITATFAYDNNNFFVVQRVVASNSTTSRTTVFTNDSATGLLTSRTDDNHITTGYSYDSLGRLSLVREAAGSPVERDTATTYEDGSLRVVTRSDLNQKGDASQVTITAYDQLGRVRLTRELEDPSQNVDDETLGIKTQARYLQTPGASYTLVSNPFREAKSSDVKASTAGWTRTTSDPAGRSISQDTFDGAPWPAPWGGNGNNTGSVLTTYTGNSVTQTDQAGRSKTSVLDALNRLGTVTENPGSSNYLTTYLYDVLDDLTNVVQDSQTRSFTYDSLKRLSLANNPESGAVSFTYDNNGNLSTKTDARGAKTFYTMDALDRVTQKSYANNLANVAYTPGVNYTYDAGGQNSIGHLTRVEALGISNTTYTNFDALGHSAQVSQSTLGSTFSTSYTYNLAGALLSEVLPSGRTVTTAYDNLNRPVQVGSSNVPYLSAVTYAAQGAPATILYGNGLSRNATYNGRLQPSELEDVLNRGTSQAKSMLDLQYQWIAANQPVNTNNGNLQGQTITADGTLTIQQSYSYDALNRLAQYAEASSGGTSGRTYSYDRFGNGWVSSNVGLNMDGATPTGSNNPFDTTSNRLLGGVYDQSGNVLVFHGSAFLFDAEGRQAIGQDPMSVGGGQVHYDYDGNGNRVAKVFRDGPGVIYVYDVQNQLVAEYDSANSVPSCQTCYVSSDHLGSTRLVTDASGNVVSRHDYLPFGEEISSGVGGRTSVWAKTDLINQKFTGKERDSESGLDYFGARYYGSALGRFTSPDQPFEDQHVEDPQSWNMYAYVRNNPLAHVDPNGKACSALLGNTDSGFCQRADAYANFDDLVHNKTRFFAAASAATQELADVAVPGLGRAETSPETRAFLESTGQTLLQVNTQAVGQIISGQMTGSGSNLDARLVHLEQNTVQKELTDLKGSDPAAYRATITELNGLLNSKSSVPANALGALGGVLLSTDKAYAQVLGGVRKGLDHDIDFANQRDREAIGRALAQHVRQTGGCDIAGDRANRCGH